MHSVCVIGINVTVHCVVQQCFYDKFMLPSTIKECMSSCRVSINVCLLKIFFNLLTPNVNYSGRTAPLTSKIAFYIFIQQI